MSVIKLKNVVLSKSNAKFFVVVVIVRYCTRALVLLLAIANNMCQARDAFLANAKYAGSGDVVFVHTHSHNVFYAASTSRSTFSIDILLYPGSTTT